MAVFVTDSFTEAGTGTARLNTHTGEVGATWTAHPALAYNNIAPLIDLDNDRVWGDGTDAAYASATPPSADYYVQADFHHVSTIAVNIGIAARMDTTADTMYYARFNSGTTWELRKWVAAAHTLLGSSTNQIPSVGNSKRGKLVVQGDQISFYVEGTLEVGPITDTSITAAGKVGIRTSGASSASTGIHVDNLEAGTLESAAIGHGSFVVNRLRPAIFKPGRAR